MKYAHLVWGSLTRSTTRTLLTLLSVVAAFLLFGMLDSVRIAFNSSASLAGADRLIVASKLSLTQPLPYSIINQVASAPSVRKASYGSWFGGVYRDSNQIFPNFAIGPDYLDVYPEYRISPEQRRAFEAERTGAIVGASLAERHGWKIGDVIPLQSPMFPRSGSSDWPLVLTGIFTIEDSKRRSEENQLLFHWGYFDEANDYVKSQIGWVVVKLDSADSAHATSRAVDRMTENSDHETRTQTEQAFNQAFARQFADVGTIVSSIMAAVFFTLLLLTGSTMAQAVGERTPELAVLKTVGFSGRSVMMLVLAESCMIALIGALLGLSAASLLMPGISQNAGGMVQLNAVLPQTWGVGLLLGLSIGLVVGFLPARRALRLNIVDALTNR